MEGYGKARGTKYKVLNKKESGALQRPASFSLRGHGPNKQNDTDPNATDRDSRDCQSFAFPAILRRFYTADDGKDESQKSAEKRKDKPRNGKAVRSI